MFKVIYTNQQTGQVEEFTFNVRAESVEIAMAEAVRVSGMGVREPARRDGQWTTIVMSVEEVK